VKTTVETVSETRVKLTVEVEPAELKPSLDAAYKAIAQQVRVPGFRPGKVPPPIIDRQVGRAVVVEQAIQDAVPQFYTDAVRENDIKVLGQPDVDVTQYNDGENLVFTAEVDVRPEITIPSYEDIAVTVDAAVPSDEDIDEQIDALRERFATLTTVERAAEVGDYVSIDLSATIDGEDVPDANAKGLSYEVGSGTLVQGLDDELTGAAAGETSTFTTELPAGENEGNEALVTVVVNGVKTKELPPLDDDFAQLASEFDTVAELTDDLRTRLGRVRVMEQGAQARDHLLEHLIDTVEFPLPESAVTSEVDYRQHDIVHSLGHDDSLFERYLESQGKTREEFDAEMRESAEKSVRAQFILDAIADRTEVQIGDSELTEYLVRQAASYQMPPQEFANQVIQAGNLPMLVADIRRNKALAGVLETAVVTDASGNTVDLAAQAGGPSLAEIAEGAGADDDYSDEDEG
jgi:trigger factor